MTPERRQNFARMMTARHIAFIGGVDAEIAIGEALRRGFKGDIWPVNPKRDTLAGLACFRSLEDLPQAPDAVFLAIPARQAVDVVHRLRELGTAGIVCYSAGFKEASEEGGILEQELIEAVGDMALIGPNCYGFINYLDDVALWPFAHGGHAGTFGAAIITQSGMFSSDITMSQRSLPLTTMISAGNQSIMDIADFIDILCEDTRTRAIGVHIEGLADIAKFERAALKALEHNTAVVALKTGRSDIGGTLTLSHTGSLSGAKELYDALFERLGIISVTNPSQFLEVLKYLCVVPAPKGTKIAGFTCSGGGATMLADHAEEIDLQFPAFSDQAKQELTTLLPPIATVSNPLDYTTPIWGQSEKTYPVFATAIEMQNADAAVLVQDYPAEGLDESKIYYSTDAEAFSRAAREHGVPAAICATLPENLDQGTREHLIAQGVAPMQGIHECLNAIAAAAWWSQRKSELSQRPIAPRLPPSPPRSGSASYMTEAAAKAILEAAAFPIPKGHLISRDSAERVAHTLEGPLALKMVNPKLVHKTEAGAVSLSLEPNDVLKEIDLMRGRVAAYDQSLVSDIFLLEEMAAKPIAELIVGITQDLQFGWSLTLGSGGILVNLIEDAKTILLPCNETDILAALKSLKSAQILKGYRDQKGTDLEQICIRIMQLCNIAMQEQNQLKEVEINPLFIHETDCLAVDALMSQMAP